jgi:WD40 repeat protein
VLSRSGVKVWRLTDKEPVFVGGEEGTVVSYDSLPDRETWISLQTARATIVGFDFSPDSKTWISLHKNGSINIYDLTSGQKVPSFRVSSYPRTMALHPKKHQVAVAWWDRVEIHDLEKGQVLAKFPLDPGPWPSVAWHPNGEVVAMVGNDRIICLWEVTTHRLLARLEGHTHDGIGFVFNHAGNLLASGDWSGNLRLWDAHAGQQLFHTQANLKCLRFSPDDRFLAGELQGPNVHIWEVAAGREYRVLGRDPALSRFAFLSCSIHPNGRLLAAGAEDGYFAFWDLTTGRSLGFLRVDPPAQVLFEPSGALLICTPEELRRWPVKEVPESPGLLRIGPPQELAPLPAVVHQLARSYDGRVLAIPVRREAKPMQLQIPLLGRRAPGISIPMQPHHDILVLSAQPLRKEVYLSSHSDVRYAAVSPDGRRVATGSHGTSQEVKVWDAATGKVEKELPVGGGAQVAFSPDGRWLAASGDAIRVWEVGSWHQRWEREGVTRSPVAFSPDSSMLAYGMKSNGALGLVDPETGREYAPLEDPHQHAAGRLVFSPDNTLLVCVGHPHRDPTVWDLRALRTRLAPLGLDWDKPPFPSPPPNPDAPPLRVEVEYGGLKMDLQRNQLLLEA